MVSQRKRKKKPEIAITLLSDSKESELFTLYNKQRKHMLSLNSFLTQTLQGNPRKCQMSWDCRAINEMVRRVYFNNSGFESNKDYALVINWINNTLAVAAPTLKHITPEKRESV